MDEVNKVHPEWIEEFAETFDPTTPPGFDKVQQTADQVRQQAVQDGEAFSQGENIPTQQVPQDEQLQRPVGTETDSY